MKAANQGILDFLEQPEPLYFWTCHKADASDALQAHLEEWDLLDHLVSFQFLSKITELIFRQTRTIWKQRHFWKPWQTRKQRISWTRW